MLVVEFPHAYLQYVQLRYLSHMKSAKVQTLAMCIRVYVLTPISMHGLVHTPLINGHDYTVFVRSLAEDSIFTLGCNFWFVCLFVYFPFS